MKEFGGMECISGLLNLD